jgi:hypothetical protein
VLWSDPPTPTAARGILESIAGQRTEDGRTGKGRRWSEGIQRRSFWPSGRRCTGVRPLFEQLQRLLWLLWPQVFGRAMSHPNLLAPPDTRPIEAGEIWENPVTRERAVVVDLPG